MLGENLTRAIAKAKQHRMTPEERRRQRVSLAYGLRSRESTITRQEAEAAVAYMDGTATETSTSKTTTKG
jgi:hypothetical protein